MSDLPTVVLPKSGLQPRQPAELRAELVNDVSAINPGYTANLPASLIEDVASTDIGAVSLMEQGRVELVNSLTPFGANAFLLQQLGNVYGVQQGQQTNTSVEVVFTGPPGFPIAKGFTVADGANQYTVIDGGIIPLSGTTVPLTAVCTLPGTFPIAANTVTNLVTSLPSGITLIVTNPQPGTPGLPAQDIGSYRAEVLAAGLAASQGMTRYLKTLLRNVNGVQTRLISTRANPGGGWEIIVGGGDDYEVANAIFEALFDVSTLVGSTMVITNITQTNPGVVTTELNHGYATGDNVTITGVLGMLIANNTWTVTVIDEKHFSIGFMAAGPAYISGGVCTPNVRNTSVAINDSPDIYFIPIVRPPLQTVAIVVAWNTTAVNFVADAAVAQLASPALVAYVNSIQVGQPMLTGQLEETFRDAVSSVLAPNLLTRLLFFVDINGVGVSPIAGTEIIQGDPESFFFIQPNGVVINRG